MAAALSRSMGVSSEQFGGRIMACRSSHKVAANAAKGSSGSEGVSGGDPPHERFSVAPMMDVTDNHFRQMCRILSKHAVLYTEMVVDNTIINNRERMEKHLAFPPEQRPVALQMGGSDPIQLREAARVASEFGYDAINLNCGCPSPRVSTGCFGAALMKDPHLVAECAKAIEEGSGIPPSVKCRLGVDDHDSYEELRDFVSVVSSCSPTRLFIIHARKAHLRGLNPAQNRTVPPLKHEWVTHLAREFPHLRFVLNGGIRSIDEAKSALDGSPEVEGVMLGRAVSNEPWNTLSRVDVSLFGEASPPVPSRRQVIREYCEYADRVRGSVVWNEEDAYIVPSVRQLVMPLMSLFHGVPRSKKWKQAVDTEMKRWKKRTDLTLSYLIDQTIGEIPEKALDEPPPSTHRGAGKGEEPSDGQPTELGSTETEGTGATNAVGCHENPAKAQRTAPAGMLQVQDA